VLRFADPTIRPHTRAVFCRAPRLVHFSPGRSDSAACRLVSSIFVASVIRSKFPLANYASLLPD
jgi:hypothetical protein